MQISATGRTEGFTLVELLIVLTIFGLLSAAVVIALPDGGVSLREEAERLAARAGAARDRAVISARPVSLRVTASGYAFEERRANQWRPIGQAPFSEQQWAAGTSVSESTTIIFDSIGAAESANVALVREDDELTVRIESDGRIEIDG